MHFRMNKFMQEGAFKQLFKKQTQGIQEKYNIKKADVRIIDYLNSCGENNTAKDIQFVSKMNKGHISTAMENLCDQGYVKAIHDEKDKRVIHYVLQEKAMPILEELDKVMKETENEIMKGVTDEEREVVKRVSGKMWDNLNRLLENK